MITPDTLDIKNIIRWNTGAPYTEHGQRISAIPVDGGVYMDDQDRGIHCFFPDCPLEKNEIMRRYLHNENQKYSCPSVDAFGQWALLDLMRTKP